MKKCKKMLAILLSLAVIVSGVVLTNPTSANATKKKVKLSAKNLTVKVGQSKKLKLKNNKKKVTWSVVSGKKCVTLKAKKKTGVTVKGKKAGKAKVQAKVGKKKYTCTVTVKKNMKSSVTTTNPSKTTTTINYAIPYQKGDIGDIYNGDNYFTMMGKKYYYGFCGEPCYNSWAQYNLAKKYHTMSYTLGHIDNTAFEDAVFILELDGTVVEQIKLTGDMTTITKTVNVENISNMKIQIRDAAHVTSWYGVANIVFDDSIALLTNLLKTDTSSTNIIKNGITYAIPYQKGDIGKIHKGDDFFTMMGEKYYYGFCGEPCYNSVAQINLEGKYKTLSYKIGHVDNTSFEDAMLIIELDGKVVEQINLTGDMVTLSKELNVKGGVNLKIQIRDAAHVTSWYGMADMILN